MNQTQILASMPKQEKNKQTNKQAKKKKKKTKNKNFFLQIELLSSYPHLNFTCS